MNEYVDKLLANIGPFAVSNGLDPLSLQDFNESVSDDFDCSV